MKTIVILLLILFTASCSVKSAPVNSTIQEENSEKTKKELKKEKSKKKLEQVVADAQPIIDNILNSMSELNHKAYMRDFNSSMKSSCHDKNLFMKINLERKEKYGVPEGRPLYRIEKRNPYYNLYYLVKFSKVEKPVTIFLSLKKEDKKLKVAFLQFRFSELKQNKSASGQ